MLNLNIYRNSHFYVLNDAKKNFKNNLIALYPELRTIKARRLNVNYTIFPHNSGLFDVMNIVSIVDKFFTDALVDFGCLPDDNYNVVGYDEPPRVFGGISRENKCRKILCRCTFFD